MPRCLCQQHHPHLIKTCYIKITMKCSLNKIESSKNNSELDQNCPIFSKKRNAFSNMKRLCVALPISPFDVRVCVYVCGQLKQNALIRSSQSVPQMYRLASGSNEHQLVETRLP